MWGDSELIKVFIGYDQKETVAYHVLAHSIISRSSLPVAVAPIMLSQLDGIMRRERNPLQSTEFSFSRFLAPSLCDYQGWSIFMDSDILVVDDIAKMWALRDDRFAVQVVKHDHQPKEGVKFLGAPQTKYEKKNWSSVMMFNNAQCRALTEDYVNTATGLQLHQFKWLDGDHLIGELPKEWNYLVDYEAPRPIEELSAIHFTLGGPYFESYQNCTFAPEWAAERERMLHAAKG
jgi:hypothetical protein